MRAECRHRLPLALRAPLGSLHPMPGEKTKASSWEKKKASSRGENEGIESGWSGRHVVWPQAVQAVEALRHTSFSNGKPAQAGTG